jgi:hypothetical protein
VQEAKKTGGGVVRFIFWALMDLIRHCFKTPARNIDEGDEGEEGVKI